MTHCFRQFSLLVMECIFLVCQLKDTSAMIQLQRQMTILTFMAQELVVFIMQNEITYLSVS